MSMKGPFVFIFVMVSYVLPFLPVSMVILELVVHDQYFYTRLCCVRSRRARPGRLVWTGLYTSRGRSFRKGGSSYRRSGEDRDRSRSAPSSTVTQPSKSGNGQATMTVAVPQELNKHQVQTHELRVLPVVNVNRGSIRVIRRNEGVLPPQSIPVKHDCVSL